MIMSYASRCPSSSSTDSPHFLRCLYLNAQSLAKDGAVQCLHSYIDFSKSDVICVVETWLTQDITDSELSNKGNMNVFRRTEALGAVGC